MLSGQPDDPVVAVAVDVGSQPQDPEVRAPDPNPENEDKLDHSSTCTLRESGGQS